ncbi:hypothetical protein QFW80_13790 [Luteimonas sp. M1R5S18]|uniref:DUF1453 domain-containing protein n=1 Tax=Luteimonas rhizosphaericola TaxID=3042024 RepID=A0ABT6JLN5_9GAMM|nr:hypothetical protein [Luteimonas rhizosphaericola]MDH5831590.1 hypothetical protein [Luteimonas rhizosphaericola]
MPLLLLPFVLLLLLALLLVLWPVGLWMRWRTGRARRRAQPLMVSFNAWALLGSALMLLAVGAMATVWIDGAALHVASGLLAGVALGGLGLRLARLEAGDGRLHYTAHAGLTGALLMLVAARVALAAWQAWHRAVEGVPAPVPWPWLADPASLWAMGGLLLGYHLGFAWTLRGRLRRLGMLRRR